MKKLTLIPVVLIVGLLLAKRLESVGQDIILPDVNVQERIIYHAKKWGLEVALVKAVAKVESNFNPIAKNPSDPSYGLMQITPILAHDYGLIRDHKNPSRLEIKKIYNIDNNLSIACDFMSRLHSKYSFDEAVQMYNVGESGYKFNGARNSSYLEKVRYHYGIYSRT